MDSSAALPPFVRGLWSWLAPVPLAYGMAVPFLGPGALFVPIVIWYAPIGILLWFDQRAFLNASEGKEEDTLAIMHGVFWALLFVGLVFRWRLPEPVLWVIWGIVVASLISSVGGCAVHLGPGLRSPGNWH